jgi:hypothetical protein
MLEDWQKLRLQNLKSFIQKECATQGSPTSGGSRTSQNLNDQWLSTISCIKGHWYALRCLRDFDR